MRRDSSGIADPRDRAEEIYHRLRCGESYQEIEPRWLPASAQYLAGVELSDIDHAHLFRRTWTRWVSFLRT